MKKLVYLLLALTIAASMLSLTVSAEGETTYGEIPYTESITVDGTKEAAWDDALAITINTNRPGKANSDAKEQSAVVSFKWVAGGKLALFAEVKDEFVETSTVTQGYTADKYGNARNVGCSYSDHIQLYLNVGGNSEKVQVFRLYGLDANFTDAKCDILMEYDGTNWTTLYTGDKDYASIITAKSVPTNDGYNIEAVITVDAANPITKDTALSLHMILVDVGIATKEFGTLEDKVPDANPVDNKPFSSYYSVSFAAAPVVTQAPATQAPTTQAPAASDDVTVPPEGDATAVALLIAAVSVAGVFAVAKKHH